MLLKIPALLPLPEIVHTDTKRKHEKKTHDRKTNTFFSLLRN